MKRTLCHRGMLVVKTNYGYLYASEGFIRIHMLGLGTLPVAISVRGLPVQGLYFNQEGSLLPVLRVSYRGLDLESYL